MGTCSGSGGLKYSYRLVTASKIRRIKTVLPTTRIRQDTLKMLNDDGD